MQCATGSLPCIIGAWRCDGGNDCEDGSDEIGCLPLGPVACEDSEFQCDDGTCIPKFLKCSGNIECKDGSDEKASYCSNSTIHSIMCDKEKEFSCDDATNTCLPFDQVCDGIKDCQSGADEVKGIGQICSGKYGIEYDFKLNQSLTHNIDIYS